jgi:hypothetical protein
MMATSRWRAHSASLAAHFCAVLALTEGLAQADEPPLPPVQQPDVVRPPEPADPTGGAYTSPTLLFIPAAAVPKWNVRVIASSELQSPADVDAKIRPGLGAELGLPRGITVAGGTSWVGGDINANTNKTDFNLGLSPYGQVRMNIIGRPDGRGFLLGASTTYKFVGFEGDPGEVEFAISSQYRVRYYELGLQAVIGKDFATTDADGEAHAYALYRPIPQLGIGAASQLRKGLVSQPGETTYDVLGGAIVSFTLGRFQIGGLGGASTLGLPSSTSAARSGGLAQLFLTARF